MKNIKDAYGLERGKVYIIKCLRGEVTPSMMHRLDVEFHEHDIEAIIVPVQSKDTLTIAEKK